jgi:hypothetical protein
MDVFLEECVPINAYVLLWGNDHTSEITEVLYKKKKRSVSPIKDNRAALSSFL